MWQTDTAWFDVAVITTISAVGSILFGRFEQHKSRGRRLLKLVLAGVIVVGLATTVGRAWAFGVLTLPLLAAAIIHLWWLPKHGVNGWTAEPYDRYLELVGHRSRDRR